MRELQSASYDYTLPQELIAKTPISPKENAKLLVYNRQEKSIIHSDFWHFNEFLPKETLVVLNDTQVLPARIYGRKIGQDSKGAKIEALFHKTMGEDSYLLQFKGRLRVGSKIAFGDNVYAQIIEILPRGFKIARFYRNDEILKEQDFFNFLEDFGHIPLPPYLKREDTPQDRIDYQSVFAKNKGAIAAPTASLHFSPESFKALQENFQIAWVTLHIGAGTFLGVEVENILEHKMHKEAFYLPQITQEKLLRAKHITAIGTTTARVLEYFTRTHQTQGECDLFLHTQNPPRLVNALLTNFHLPKSTLLMLVASFVGLEEMQKIYQEALKMRYRFYSYGDGMLIL